MTLWQGLLAFVLIVMCGLLMIVILLQRGRGGGLAGAFGGSGGSSAFGAKTGDVFTWITVVLASVFVLLSMAANFVFDQSATVLPTATIGASGDGPAPGAPGDPVGGVAAPEPIKVMTSDILIPPDEEAVDGAAAKPAEGQAPADQPAGAVVPVEGGANPPAVVVPGAAGDAKEEPKIKPASGEDKPGE